MLGLWTLIIVQEVQGVQKVQNVQKVQGSEPGCTREADVHEPLNLLNP
jgi:hypothetical protein